MSKKKVNIIDDGQFDLLEELGQKKRDKLTGEQEVFVYFEGEESVILKATAGSGKSFSCVQRLKFLIKNGEDPNRLIFFSFTKAATEELASRVRSLGIPVRDSISKGEGVTITTIHAFANSLLARMGKFKKIATFYEFINWFKFKYKPSRQASREKHEEFKNQISEMFENMDQLSSAIGSFKLLMSDNIKAPFPLYMNDYNLFLRETKKRDFSDILIEVDKYLKDNKWLKMFRDAYDYIFIDEYQDTSVIQLKILLALNASKYYLIGDENQSIYLYSNASCAKLETLLRSRREVKEMTLSINFRSDKALVENSNKHSKLVAIANSEEEGHINKKVMLRIDELVELLRQKGEIVVLVRTNSVIKKLEKELIRKKIPMRFDNYINKGDIKSFHDKDISPQLRMKLNSFKGFFENDSQVIAHIERFKKSNKFITTIHKSKGREFDECVIVNSISSDILKECGIYDKLGSKRLKRITFDPDKEEEAVYVHFVAVSRSKHKLHYMIYE